MKILEAASDMRAQSAAWRRAGERIGFVPTMGNLHAGHLSLVERARQRADRVVVSIFVNPLQFGPHEDFERYPRTFEADVEKLAALGVDAVFHPAVETMYPRWPQPTVVRADPDLAARWEGAARPGHFDGVTTVVLKLFNLVQPDVAVFGQKDYQQWRILSRMVEDLDVPVEMVRAPIAREQDGLAMSSRNQYLDARQRAIAPALYATLRRTAEALLAGSPVADALEAGTARLQEAGFDAVDYLALCDGDTLEPLAVVRPGAVLLAAARLGTTRLLDNLLLDEPGG